ncbi:hypothetical protein M8037_16855 [Sinorhizobium meliloti]|nr:hypothetical protein [Sinorhizobium meliloti]MCM5690432.1 hypothetical protein [Sinorhizobium meliloti]
MASPITRRRAICIMAAAAGLPLLDLRGRAEAAVAAVTWRGRALGAPATLILNLESQADAAGLVDRVVAGLRGWRGCSVCTSAIPRSPS